VVETTDMISVTQAKKKVLENGGPGKPEVRPLQEAFNLTLAADVFAVTDIPAYPQSSMDGYAFSFNGWKLHNELVIEGEIAAGSNEALVIEPQRAVRIFTGAAIPNGADTVVMQEKVRTENDRLIIEDAQLQQGINVRPAGSEIRAGALAMQKGTRLTPAAAGFLAGIGIAELQVYPPPSISIILTGNELQQPGSGLNYGQVYESSSFSLRAALHQMHITGVKIQQVPDNLADLTNALQQALHDSDIILLTGGVSVGDYDFVLQAAANCKVNAVFHKVSQKPGKPLYFGKREEKLVFGLPGNPSSVLTCFYMYVVPAIEQFCQNTFGLKTIRAPLGKSYKKTQGLTHFLKGYYDGQKASPLTAQESYRMYSFAQANCLIQIDETVTECSEGTQADVHLLNF
jgi:molybdopterin molybdotransferase